MSRLRDELLEIRKTLFARVDRMRKLGDYGAGAADVRETAEAVLKLLDIFLERWK